MGESGNVSDPQQFESSEGYFPVRERKPSLEKVTPRVYTRRIPISPDQVEMMRSFKTFADRVRRAPGEGENVIDYSVIDADTVREEVPELWARLEELEPRLRRIAEKLWKGPLKRLEGRPAVNINYVHKGGEQGFHKDRNEVTMLLYFTRTEGGALEYELPDGTTASVSPEPGKIVILVRANELSHRVAPVLGDEERIVLAVSYGAVGKDHDVPGLDAHIYSNKQ